MIGVTGVAQKALDLSWSIHLRWGHGTWDVMTVPQKEGTDVVSKISRNNSLENSQFWKRMGHFVKFCKTPVKIRLPGVQKKVPTFFHFTKRNPEGDCSDTDSDPCINKNRSNQSSMSSQNLVGHASNTHHHPYSIAYPIDLGPWAIFHQSATWITLKERGLPY